MKEGAMAWEFLFVIAYFLGMFGIGIMTLLNECGSGKSSTPEIAQEATSEVTSHKEAA